MVGAFIEMMMGEEGYEGVEGADEELWDMLGQEIFNDSENDMGDQDYQSTA